MKGYDAIGDLSGILEKIEAGGMDALESAISATVGALKAGRKVLVFGNGGSAAEAQHFAAELVNRFLKERRAIPAIALTTDTSALTAIANDKSFDQVFSRQLEAFGEKGDVAIALSTSGNSPNIIEGLKAAKAKGMLTIALTGEGGGKLASTPGVAPDATPDYLLAVPSNNTPRIQEAHLLILHILAEEIET
ncbi:MAG TPA: SIS domain-containing protein, partial [Acidobacteriota bacterium]|nr:SIS domain-containing protein [Acidobacteriota bacterium]